MSPSNLGIVFAPCTFRHDDPAVSMANNALECNFGSWGVSKWNRELVDSDYYQATRKWLVRQGHGGASGGVIHDMEGRRYATTTAFRCI
jgi:hypothetical protein